MTRRRLTGLALAGGAAALLAGGTAAYGFYVLDWRCPDELRVRSPEEVEGAFADEGLELEPAEIAVAVPDGSSVYRHVGDGAMVYVLVCPNPCSPDTSIESYSPPRGPSQRMRYGVGFVNVDIWITDADRRSARAFTEPIHRIVDEKLVPPTPDRCYIG
jgi:hypothetical protein